MARYQQLDMRHWKMSRRATVAICSTADDTAPLVGGRLVGHTKAAVVPSDTTQNFRLACRACHQDIITALCENGADEDVKGTLLILNVTHGIFN